MREKLLETMPSAIDSLKQIIEDKTASPKIIISASNALVRTENTLKKMEKEINNAKD